MKIRTAIRAASTTSSSTARSRSNRATRRPSGRGASFGTVRTWAAHDADLGGAPAMKPQRIAILAEGLFAPRTAKTAIGVLRYAPYEVVAIVDSVTVGKDAFDIVGVGRGVPIVASVDEALALGAEALLIGTAAAGGQIAASYRPHLARALERGLTVWNGLHERVLSDPALAAAAQRGGGRVRELREPPAELPIGGHRVR